MNRNRLFGKRSAKWIRFFVMPSHPFQMLFKSNYQRNSIFCNNDFDSKWSRMKKKSRWKIRNQRRSRKSTFVDKKTAVDDSKMKLNIWRQCQNMTNAMTKPIIDDMRARTYVCIPLINCLAIKCLTMFQPFHTFHRDNWWTDRWYSFLIVYQWDLCHRKVVYNSRRVKWVRRRFHRTTVWLCRRVAVM